MNCEIFSVGPPQPLTIGLSDIGFLCIFSGSKVVVFLGLCHC